MKFLSILSRTSVTLVAVMFILSSCSIQKRHYTTGYYVEWHKKNSLKIKNTTIRKSTVDKVVANESNINKSNIDSLCVVTLSNERLPEKTKTNRNIEKGYSNSIRDKKTKVQTEKGYDQAGPDSIGKFNTPPSKARSNNDDMAMAAQVTGIGSWVWIIILNLLSESAAMALTGFILSLALIFAMLGVIFGIVYLYKTKGDEDKRRRRRMARRGMIWGLCFLSIILLGSVLILMAGSI